MRGEKDSHGRRTGVVKLSSLANGKTTTANDEHLLDINVLLGFYHSAREVGLRVGRGLRRPSARQDPGGGEESLLTQPGARSMRMSAEESILRAGSQGAQLRGSDWDAATMTEDGRSAARLIHGRQHCSERT